MATVMPHGVLFRGGKELEIRRRFIDDDLIEAVIGLPNNLFFGTGIPACILVMRRPHEKPEERKNKILFINADREYESGRAINYLRAEHVEKIVEAFRNYEEIPGFSRIVTLDEIRAEDCNLNIRRYADNSPPPEPQDVRAHLVGGVPKAEVESHRPLFESHGLDVSRLFAERDQRYVDFAPEFDDKSAIRQMIREDPGVAACEDRFLKAFGQWWESATDRLVRLPETGDPMQMRAEWLESFVAALEPLGLLDRFKLVGALVTWWDESADEIRTVAERGFEELVDGWIDTIRDVIEDTESKKQELFDPFEHKLVKRLLPGYLQEIEDCKLEIARLEDEKRAFEQQGEEDEADGEEDDENGELRDPCTGLPPTWEVGLLGNYMRATDYGISSSLADRGRIPILRMHNIAEGHIDLSDLKYSDARAAEKLLLRPKDVLFNRTNSMEHVGRTGIWLGELARASFASYLVRLVPDDSRLKPEYLNAWLNWDVTQIRIRRFATPGVQQVNINPTNLCRVQIALPKDTDEQDRIIDRLTAQDAQIASHAAELEKLRKLKSGLMHDLLTGKVRVTSLEAVS